LSQEEALGGAVQDLPNARATGRTAACRPTRGAVPMAWFLVLRLQSPLLIFVICVNGRIKTNHQPRFFGALWIGGWHEGPRGGRLALPGDTESGSAGSNPTRDSQVRRENGPRLPREAVTLRASCFLRPRFCACHAENPFFIPAGMLDTVPVIVNSWGGSSKGA